MSLSDRYNRGEGRIQSFDKYLTDLGNKAGNFWHVQTGYSRRTLTQGLYIVAALSATQAYVFSHQFMSLVFAAVAILGFMGAMPAMGGVVEQIQAEAAGLPKNTLAAMRLQVLGIGVFMLAVATSRVLADLTGQAPLNLEFVNNLLLGMSFTALQASDYIRRTNPITPSGGGRGQLRRTPA
jgi:hypothetical protein